jgi:hypothetical protein
MPVFELLQPNKSEIEHPEGVDFESIDFERGHVARAISQSSHLGNHTDEKSETPSNRKDIPVDASTKRAHQQPLRISDMFALIAGPFAHDLAEIDPFPHPYLMCLPKGRLHLLAFLIANGMEPVQANSVVTAAREWPGKKIPGLPSKSLSQRMSLPLWDSNSYQALAACLKFEAGKRFVSQAETVTPERSKLFMALPERLRTAAFARTMHVPEEAELLSCAFRVLDATGLMDEASYTNVVKSPGRAAVFARLSEIIEKRYSNALGAERFGPALGIALPPQYKQIRSNRELATVGDQFRNCLGDYQEELLDGEIAFLVRDGAPRVVIGIKPTISGEYCFWQMEAPRGQTLAPELRAQIFDELLLISIINNDEWNSFIQTSKRALIALAEQDHEQIEIIRRNARKCAKALIYAEAAFKWTGRQIPSQAVHEQ